MWKKCVMIVDFSSNFSNLLIWAEFGLILPTWWHIGCSWPKFQYVWISTCSRLEWTKNPGKPRVVTQKQKLHSLVVHTAWMCRVWCPCLRSRIFSNLEVQSGTFILQVRTPSWMCLSLSLPHLKTSFHLLHCCMTHGGREREWFCLLPSGSNTFNCSCNFSLSLVTYVVFTLYNKLLLTSCGSVWMFLILG